MNLKEKLKTVDPGPKDPDTKFQTQKNKQSRLFYKYSCTN